jgi:hypothetical protein
LKKTGEMLNKRTIEVDLAIPNQEVLSIYENQITEWFNDKVKQKDLSVMHNALLSGDAETLQTELENMLYDTISYLDSSEAFYHGVLVGLFSHIDNGYMLKSNREAGNGRYDICVYNRSFRKPAAVIEIKKAERVKQMEKSAEEALAQIAEKGYDAWLGELGYEECWHVGIGFFRKSCEVKIEKAEIEQEE